jgi:hypothetical protein
MISIHLQLLLIYFQFILDPFANCADFLPRTRLALYQDDAPHPAQFCRSDAARIMAAN